MEREARDVQTTDNRC